MSEPLWLSTTVVRLIHESQLARHCGLSGIREPGLLDSALTRPKTLFHYAAETPSIERLAATYAFGICSNHPFNDGNKRTAFLAAYVFLRRNELEFSAPETDVAETFLSLAAGELSEEALAGWFARHSSKSADAGAEDPKSTT